MSILSDVEKELGIVETDVVQFFSVTLPKIEQEVATEIEKLAQEFDNVLQWIGAHGQEISNDVLGLVGIIASLGTGIPAPVMAAASLLNKAVSLVNTAIAAQQQVAAKGGTALQQAIAAGGAAYQGLKTAQVATSQAQAHVASGS